MVAGRVDAVSTPGAPAPALPQGPTTGDHDEQPMHLTEIQAALADAMIETRYQPVVRLSDRAPVGLEALARLNHPVRGTVLPDDFVPQIEDAGLAAQLTELVAASAFADMAGPALAPLGLTVSLNFPLDVLLLSAALTRLEAQRQAANIPVERVLIELTESRPVQDVPALRRALETIRGIGYRIVIDDVGPAVPLRDTLLDLPFTGMKLDKELVLRMRTAPDALTMVRRTIEIAKQRGLTVVAEGVEDVAMWHLVQRLGVDQVQGFLVAHPLPAAAVPVWLKSWQDQPAF
ncbi:MAG TPA: EAL domain-containing protein [Acetobacteraceae bacterium]|jgi:EAL domain-containing protein (putative c-di-GMP-specific phosphodiesterase class I)|nr:EAL domain-containing protein [Acetobacteraceae bacterium]